MINRQNALIGLIFVLFSVWFAHCECLALKRGPAHQSGMGDIVRQWNVCQYILNHRNPWSLSYAILAHTYGPSNESRTTINRVPTRIDSVFDEDILSHYGPPEATYPPSAIGLLTITIGLLPSTDAVLAVWLVLQLVSLLWLASLISRLPTPWHAESRLVSFSYTIVAIILFSPFCRAIESGQFSILCLACLLFAFSNGGNDSVRGVALGIALMKPSIALPFFLAAVVKSRWKTVFAAVALHCVGIAIVVLSTNVNPIRLIGEWLSVAKFFLTSGYTLQAIINYLGWQADARGSLMTLLALLSITFIFFLCRQAAEDVQVIFLGAASTIWTYHLHYDFVCLFPALLLLMAVRRRTEGNQPFVAVSIGLFSFIVISVNFAATGELRQSLPFKALGLLCRIDILCVIIATTRLLFRSREVELIATAN